MVRRTRRRLALGAVLAGAALVIAGAATPAMGEETPQVKTTALASNLSCGVEVLALDSQQRIVKHRYSSNNGVASWSTATWDDSQLGFTPRSMVKKGSKGAEDPNALGSSGIDFYANSSDGSFYLVGVDMFGGITKKLVNSTWGKVRLMAGVPQLSGTQGAYVYAIHDSGAFYRYNTPTGPSNLYGATLVGTNWSGVKTLTWLTFKYLSTAPGSGADVLLATTNAGQLVEYTIPHADPTKWTRKDVRPTSWQNLTSLTVGSCAGTLQTPFIGTLSNGDAYLYLDKNSDQPASTDILAYGRIATGWGPSFYSSGWRG
ncbi:hypothetical protein ACUOFU_06405 [Microbacterium arabinogalactanolyticum]|uniref:hypothetical protein n=1 Tax=Microbacterium arabinogalactanolyticum TaxID=69365 RepID=UPI004044560E